MSDSSQRWPFIALLGLAAVAPFNVRVASSAWTDLNLRLLVIVALIIVVGVVVQGLWTPHWHLPDRVDAFAFGWLAAVWLSALLSEDLALGAGGAARLSVAIMLIPATRSVVRSKTDALRLLRFLAFGSAAGAVVGLVVWLRGDDVGVTEIFVGKVTSLGPFNRLTRPWAHANIAAMALGATVAAASTVTHRVSRLALLCMLTVALVLTISRGGLVAGLAAGVVWVVLRRSKREALVVASLVSVAALVVALTSAWTTRIDQLGNAAFYQSSVKAPSTFVVGGAADMVEVTVTNESATTWLREGADRVLISARWLGDDGLIWTEDWWQLPEDLVPGQSVTTGLTIGPRVPDGVFQVRWDLVIPDRAYFGQFLGDEPILSQATVVGSSVKPGDNFRYPLVPRNIDIGRVDAWKLAIEDFQSSPVVGVGPNQFGDRVVRDWASDGRLVGVHAHNIVLEPLATWGLLGFVPFAVLGAGALGRALLFGWRSRGLHWCVIAAGLAAIVVHGIVDWPLVVITTGIPVGMLVGLAWCELSDTAEDGEEA